VQASSSNTFTPNSVTVAVGGTVTWGFAIEHNVLFSGAGAPQDIGVTGSGSVARVFNTAGTFPYTCSLHAGMSGTVLVASPSIFAQMNGANERPLRTLARPTEPHCSRAAARRSHTPSPIRVFQVRPPACTFTRRATRRRLLASSSTC
jgi:hypothetical protein